jgi:thiol:disulfide interchange protein DsbD
MLRSLRNLLHPLVLGIAVLSFASSLTAQVQASLVAPSGSIQPGKPFTVALRLQHQEKWHTYWINPGTGLPTSIEWKLPAGFKAGPILWPTPRPIHDAGGQIVGNGYEGETFLLTEITPPASLQPGTPVRLEANSDWLMCSESCVPGNASVSLPLSVTVNRPGPPTEWTGKIDAAIKHLPAPVPGWSVSVERTPSSLKLSLTPSKSAAPARIPTAGELRLFGNDPFIAFEQAQSISISPEGVISLVAPISQDSLKEHPTRFQGILRAEKGWNASGTAPGFLIDTAIKEVAAFSTASSSTSNAAPAQSAPSLLFTLALALMGGLILNLMPCVFPVLGIKIMGFVHQSGSDRAKVIAHGLVFTLGVLLSFWTLAGVLAVLRSGGSQLGWGFQLQSPAFVFILAAIMLVFALSMSGVFEFGMSATSVGSDLQMKSGYGGSFFTGVLATLVATPCSAPFLAPALGAALSLSTLESFAIFTAIAIGLSTPYLLLSIFPAVVKLLPRPGAWMETFRQIMAFPLYATVAYLIWVLAAQTSDNGFRNVLFGLVLVAFATWIYGRWNAPERSRRAGIIGTGVAVLVLTLSGWVGWPSAPSSHGVTWEPWSEARVKQLQAEGRTVYVDFTARWCATCQTNKAVVFSSADVLKRLSELKAVTLRGDWTNRDPAITTELARWQRSAVPFNLVYKPGSPSPIALPEVLTPGIVLDALK